MSGDLIFAVIVLAVIVSRYLTNQKGGGADKVRAALDQFIPRNLSDKFRNFNRLGSPKVDLSRVSTIFSLGGGVVLLLVWMATGFYVVGPTEQGVETRFGKYTTTALPGLHYHLPYPFESVKKVAVTSIHNTEVGGSTRSQGSAAPQDSIMITRDENVVDINFAIQWRVKDAMNYVFNIKGTDVDSTIKNTAESVMRSIIGLNDMTCILGNCRAQISQDCQEKLQSALDQYDIGVIVVSVPLKRVDPPSEVRDAFLDVQSARADRERLNNEAFSIRNDLIPRAKGEAAKILNEAQAYSYKTINAAHAEVQKISAFCPTFQADEGLLRAWFESNLVSSLSTTKKILGNGKNLNVLNLPKEMMESSQTEKSQVKSEER